MKDFLIETRNCLYKKKTKKEREQMIFLSAVGENFHDNVLVVLLEPP